MFWVIYVIVILVVQEVVFSFCFPLPEITNINRSYYTPVPNNVAPWKPIRYETLTYTSAPDSLYTSYHYLNQYGFRDHDWTQKKESDKQRVMFVGDSFVEGAMSTVEQSIPYSFQSAGDDTIEVMNAGISGAGLPEYAKVIHDLVPAFEPDVVILVLFANDIGIREANISTTPYVPEYSISFLPRIFHVLRRIAAGEPSGFRWGPERPLNPAVPDPANHWTLLYDKYAAHVDPAIVKHMQEGNFNIWRINYLKFEEINLKRHVELAPFIKQVQEYVADNEAELMICYIPSRNQVSNYYLPFDKLSCQIMCNDSMDLTQAAYQIHRKSLDSICRRYSIPYFDVTPFIASKEELNRHMYWNYDDHFLPVTYSMVGQEIYKYWLGM